MEEAPGGKRSITEGLGRSDRRSSPLRGEARQTLAGCSPRASFRVARQRTTTARSRSRDRRRALFGLAPRRVGGGRVAREENRDREITVRIAHSCLPAIANEVLDRAAHERGCGFRSPLRSGG